MPHHPPLQPDGPTHCLPHNPRLPGPVGPSPGASASLPGLRDTRLSLTPQCLLPTVSRLPLHGALPYLTDADFAGVCTGLEALSWLILPTLMLTVLLEGEGWGGGGVIFSNCPDLYSKRSSLVAQRVKNLPAMPETQVRSLGQ